MKISTSFISRFFKRKICSYSQRRIKSSHRMCSIKTLFLKISQNSQENICARVFFSIKLLACLRPATLLKKTLAQVFSYEFCKILKNTYFTENLRTTASENDCWKVVYKIPVKKTLNKSFSILLKCQHYFQGCCFFIF